MSNLFDSDCKLEVFKIIKKTNNKEEEIILEEKED